MGKVGPTLGDVYRWTLMQDIGCIACHMDGNPGVPADVHHLLDGGRRRGHDATVSLCPAHHRNPVEGVPCVAKNIREFREKYGTDEQLLQYQNRLIAEYKRGFINGRG